MNHSIILQALFVQAIQYQKRGDLDQAAKLYSQMLVIVPSDIVALNNLGKIMFAKRQFAEALMLHDQAINAEPYNPDHVMNRVRALIELGRSEEAILACDAIVTYWPDYAPGWTARGGLMQKCRNFADAIDNYSRAIALQPTNYEALNNLGVLYAELNDYKRALDSLDQALLAAPDSWQAYNNRGNALRGLGHFEDALESYSRAQVLNPEYAEAFYNQGDLLLSLRRFEDAGLAYDRAAMLAPEMPYVRGAQLCAKMQLCGWTDFDNQYNELLKSVDNGDPVASPFVLLLLPSSPLQQLRAARLYSERHFTSVPSAVQLEHYQKRIRIAYVSATFRHHPTMQLASGMFSNHDRQRFEVFAYSLGPSDGSATRTRVEGAFEHFVDAHAMDDISVAQMIREHKIDIAIDLDGFIEGSRIGVLAQRPAPIQASWLGYPGTMGAEHIDYIIADNHVIPREEEAGFSERIARLPFSYQPNSERPIVAPPSSRAEVGLPAEGFVFCCFNNLCKITPDVFAVWLRLLTKTPGSVLWLLGDNTTAQYNLIRYGKLQGIAEQRFIFAPRVDQLTHFSRMMAADLFVDTFHYNAHTTASDALWAGLPVITKAGRTFAGRVGASLLFAVGLPELITHSAEEYERLIFTAVREPDFLAGARRKLAKARTTSPLFDIVRFTRDFETMLVGLVSG